jgi:hypothetical protein
VEFQPFFLAADSFKMGELGPAAQVPGCGEPVHIQADPGDDGVRGEQADAGDLIELRGRVGRRGDLGLDLGLDLGDIGLGWMLPGGHGSADPGWE